MIEIYIEILEKVHIIMNFSISSLDVFQAVLRTIFQKKKLFETFESELFASLKLPGNFFSSKNLKTSLKTRLDAV